MWSISDLPVQPAIALSINTRLLKLYIIGNQNNKNWNSESKIEKYGDKFSRVDPRPQAQKKDKFTQFNTFQLNYLNENESH